MEDVGASLKTSAGGLLARLKVEALLSIAEKLRSLQQAGQGKYSSPHMESSKLHLWIADFTLLSKIWQPFGSRSFHRTFPNPPPRLWRPTVVSEPSALLEEQLERSRRTNPVPLTSWAEDSAHDKGPKERDEQETRQDKRLKKAKRRRRRHYSTSWALELLGFAIRPESTLPGSTLSSEYLRANQVSCGVQLNGPRSRSTWLGT